MIPKPLEDITEADLNGLVSGSVPEGRTIEYKAELPAGTNDEKIKFLRAVTSLANTAGGDLIIGVQAQRGIPTAVPGLLVAPADQDGEKLRLENILRDGVQERVRLVSFRYVPLTGGNVVLLVRVPKSFNAPHRVTIGGHSDFYARNSSGAYRLDVPELRQAFLQAPTVAARMKAFREDRLAQIAAGQPPVPLSAGGRLVFHTSAFGAFMDTPITGLELTQHQAYEFAPPNLSGMTVVHNFDRYLVYYGGEQAQENYVQVFRSGIVEYVSALHHEDGQGRMRVNGSWVEADLFNTAPRFATLLNGHGVAPPYYFMLSLLGIRNHIFDTGSAYSRRGDAMAGRDNVVFPEIATDTTSFHAQTLLRPLANRLWNTFGYAASQNYTADGTYSPRGR
jgi:hypothetical protein